MRPAADFPYYDGLPVEIGPFGWLSVVVAFFALVGLPFPDFPLTLVPALVFTGLPLVVLALVTGGRQGALFRPVGVKEIALAIGFGLGTVVLSFATALVLTQFAPMSANAAAATLSQAGPAETAQFMLRTAIQLVGEEVMTILPLLAVLWLCVRRFGLSRRVGLVLAVIVSTIWFGAVHLPTYDWNIVQCFGGIGMARLALTAAFLVTRNLWVSAGAHIINDWTEFLLPVLLGGHEPIAPGA